jgi:hypothetical protein
LAKLTKSLRIKAIKDISDRLSTEEWTTIDLTLKTFGLPISDTWSGDKRSYVIDKVGDAEDEVLGELADHFGMEGYAEVSTSPPDPPFWQEGKLRVFLSHLSAQREQAAQIKEQMQWRGMSGFVAHNDIEPTMEWQVEIETALASCDLLVAIFHPGFVESRWCDQEIGYALGRGVPVFTVKCGQDPHGFVGRFQSLNGNGKSPVQIAEDVFERAISHKKLQSRTADILVSLFIDCGSYATARERIGLLENLKVWKAGYSTRIIQAIEDNSQVRDSWGVPERVSKLVEKWNAAGFAT